MNRGIMMKCLVPVVLFVCADGVLFGADNAKKAAVVDNKAGHEQKSTDAGDADVFGAKAGNNAGTKQFDKKQQELVAKLVYASCEGRFEEVKDLVKRGANVNGECSDPIGYGNTPLFVAVSGGHLEIVKFLLSKGANVEQPDRSCEVARIPLQGAAWIGRGDIADLLIERGAQIDIYSAAALGRTNDVARLLAKNPELARKKNHFGDSPLNWLVSAGEGLPETAPALWLARIACAEMLIKQGADVNALSNNKSTALHCACYHNAKYRLVELLLAKGANVNAVADDELTPLSYAAYYSKKSIVELLLSKGADLNTVRPRDKGTPLHWAFHNNNPDWSEIAELLILKGLDVNKKLVDGLTPLHLAASKGRVDIKKPNEFDPLWEYDDRGSTNIVRLLIDKHANLNAQDNKGNTPLHLAVQVRHTNIVAMLVAKGADIDLKNKAGIAPIDIARTGGFAREIARIYEANGRKVAKEVVSVDDLIRMIKGTDPDKWAKVKAMVEENPSALNEKSKDPGVVLTPFVYAVYMGDMPTVEFMVAKGGDVKDPEALMLALVNSRNNLAKFLLEKGALVNPPKFRNPPLCMALGKGNREMVNLLLQKGAEINPDTELSSPLGAAIRSGKEELVQLMIEKGAEINPKKTGLKPLDDAVIVNNEEMVLFLLEKGADVNSGAIFTAIQQNNVKMTELLIEKGADVNKVNKSNESPLSEARSWGAKEIAELLIKHGAKE